MQSISKILLIGCALLMTAFATNAETTNVKKSAATSVSFNKQDPHALIKQVSERTFARFRQDRSLIEKDINHLKVIIAQELMPYIHHKYSAAKVLGKNRKKLSKQEFAQFSEVFKEYLILTYANVFTLYDQQKVIYAGANKAPKGRITSVRVSIIDDDRPPIKIDFKLIKSKKTGDWNAFDMIAEGVSMVASKQGEFNAVIRKHGVAYLMEQLATKAKQSVEKKVVK